jgi:small ligand-binding sensory domain FIST
MSVVNDNDRVTELKILKKSLCLSSMEHLNADLLIQVISFLNIIDSSSLCGVSRRMCYLTHQFRTLLGSQISTSSSSLAWENERRRPQDNYGYCLSQMSTKPNLAFTFTSDVIGQDLCYHLNHAGPNGLIVLGASASGIQANCDQRVEHEIDAALLLASFPTTKTTILPFSFTQPCDDKDYFLPSAPLWQQLATATPTSHCHDQDYWKVVIIYACGDGYYTVEDFVATLQRKYPDMTIVGGICESGFVSVNVTKDYLAQKSEKDLEDILHARKVMGRYPKNKNENAVYKEILIDQVWRTFEKRKYVVENVTDGIFGVALGGDIPVRSIVSRGVKSVTPLSERDCWIVEKVTLLRPGESEYMFRGDPSLLKPTHVIQFVRNKATDKLLSPLSLLAGNKNPEFVGLRRPDTDGYELHPLSPFSLQSDSIVIMTDGSPEQEESIQYANIDFFILDGVSCKDHMDKTLKSLQEATIGEVILGGLMFSCSGRGPEKRSILREEMSDAKQFHKYFPKTNLCGFYAGGEIGPMAMAEQSRVFQRGKAAVQGFTAVFALFIVPSISLSDFHLDDSPENTSTFMKEFTSI